MPVNASSNDCVDRTIWSYGNLLGRLPSAGKSCPFFFIERFVQPNEGPSLSSSSSPVSELEAFAGYCFLGLDVLLR